MFGMFIFIGVLLLRRGTPSYSRKVGSCLGRSTEYGINTFGCSESYTIHNVTFGGNNKSCLHDRIMTDNTNYANQCFTSNLLEYVKKQVGFCEKCTENVQVNFPYHYVKQFCCPSADKDTPCYADVMWIYYTCDGEGMSESTVTPTQWAPISSSISKDTIKADVTTQQKLDEISVEYSTKCIQQKTVSDVVYSTVSESSETMDTTKYASTVGFIILGTIAVVLTVLSVSLAVAYHRKSIERINLDQEDISRAGSDQLRYTNTSLAHTPDVVDSTVNTTEATFEIHEDDPRETIDDMIGATVPVSRNREHHIWLGPNSKQIRMENDGMRDDTDSLTTVKHKRERGGITLHKQFLVLGMTAGSNDRSETTQGPYETIRESQIFTMQQQSLKCSRPVAALDNPDMASSLNKHNSLIAEAPRASQPSESCSLVDQNSCFSEYCLANTSYGVEEDMTKICPIIDDETTPCDNPLYNSVGQD